MNREFFVNILFLVFINLLIKPLFIFGIDLTVQNRVGDTYGLCFALLNLTYIFSILSDFGIQNFNNRHISQNPGLLPQYFPNLFALKMLLSGLYITFTFGVGLILGYNVDHLLLLLILLCNAVLTQFMLFLRSNISGLGFYRLDSLLSSLDKLLMLLTCSVALWANPLPIPFTIELFALSQTMALLLTVLIIYATLRSKVAFNLRPSWAGNWRAGVLQLYSLLQQTTPFALIILLMFAYSRLDVILVGTLASGGKMHADVYAGAYRLFDACNMFGYLFATLLLPMFARQLKTKERMSPLTLLSLRLIWAGSIAICGVVFFAREELVQLMMPDRASPYRWDTLGVLIWAFVPACVTYIFSTLLTADERLGVMNRYFLAGIAIDLGLNLLLLPHYQALGAAVATLATQIFIATAMVFICVKTYKFRLHFSVFSQLGGYFIVVIAAQWLVFTQLSWPVYQRMALALTLSLIAALGFKLLDLKKIKNTL